MHVDKMAEKLDEIKNLWETLNENPIFAKPEEVKQLEERIIRLYDKYNDIAMNGGEYVPQVKHEISQIVFTIKLYQRKREQALAAWAQSWAKKYKK